MTLSEAIRLLKEAEIESAASEARQIFKSLGGFADYELIGAVSTDKAEVSEAVRRRASREPLQYVLGEAYFYRECYKVTPDCLIPRFDTEILVDYAVKHLPRGAIFIDLCCGSGCVGISTLNNTEDTRCISVDLSEAAVSLTLENARRIGVRDRLTTVCADAMEYAPSTRPAAVLSNPPYVSESAYGALAPEIYHEPKMAFVGGEDGGDFYRALTPKYRDIIAEDGFIAYEIGYDQSELIRTVAIECRMSCEIIPDLSGNPRVAVLKRL